MKKFSKILSVALLVALVLSLGVANAFADTEPVRITVNRDSSFDSAAAGNREYTWYRVFTVAMDGTHTATGGGVNSETGLANGITNGGDATAFAYTATQAVATKLGTWDATTSTWSRTAATDDDSGNQWFDLAPIAGTTNYSVSWVGDNTATRAADAAAWLIKHGAYEGTGSLTGVDATKDSKGNFTQWTAEVPAGYYLIESSEGANLVAATTDITIAEKNSYPTIDKKQNDKEAADYVDTAVNVKVGDPIYYEVTVKVPNDANKPIAVLDKMSEGLTFDSTTGLTIKIDGTPVTSGFDWMRNSTNNPEYDSTIDNTTNGWQIKFAEATVIANKGKTIVITFKATVNAKALVDTGRENEVTLKYDNDHYVIKDKVEFDIGAVAIVKYDGATADLDSTTNTLTEKTGKTLAYLEATFKLTDKDGKAINVSPAVSGGKGVYVVDANSNSNEVISDKQHDGLILIYGLDPEVEYILTETATEPGYNLIAGTVPLTMAKADVSDVNMIKVVAGAVSAGKSDAAPENTLTLTPLQVVKVANNSGTVLPSTGGIGTTIFYVVGGVLVLAAIILLVTKKRMSE